MGDVSPSLALRVTAGQAGSLPHLPHHFLHHPPRHVGQPEIAAAHAVGEFEVARGREVEDGGVEVVDVDPVEGRLVADFVGRAVEGPPLASAAGQPEGEGVRVVVAAGADSPRDGEKGNMPTQSRRRATQGLTAGTARVLRATSR